MVQTATVHTEATTPNFCIVIVKTVIIDAHRKINFNMISICRRFFVSKWLKDRDCHLGKDR